MKRICLEFYGITHEGDIERYLEDIRKSLKDGGCAVGQKIIANGRCVIELEVKSKQHENEFWERFEYTTSILFLS